MKEERLSLRQQEQQEALAASAEKNQDDNIVAITVSEEGTQTKEPQFVSTLTQEPQEEGTESVNGKKKKRFILKFSHSHHHHHGAHAHAHDDDDTESKPARKRNLNIEGVFLHVLGDALGSVGVVVTSLVVIFGGSGIEDRAPWKQYIDPVMTLLIVLLLLGSTIPLAKSAAYILLQFVPDTVPINRIRTEIMNVPGVQNVHELHVWQLSDSKFIASVHVVIDGTKA
ncbi:hypothetical protein HK102_009030, partial [Quaeritorhiza haematococci]